MSVSPVTEKKLSGMTKSGVTAPGRDEKPDVAIKNVLLAENTPGRLFGNVKVLVSVVKDWLESCVWKSDAFLSSMNWIVPSGLEKTSSMSQP